MPTTIGGGRDRNSAGPPAGSPGSRRARLSERRIIKVALAHIDQHGVEGLTMRRLGRVLGVEATALYRYVGGREDILTGVADLLATSVGEDHDVLAVPRYGWRDFLRRLAHGVRRVALTHPRAFPLMAAPPGQWPWLRPPLRSPEWAENVLGGLRGEGFSDSTAVAAYRALTNFLLGHLLPETTTLAANSRSGDLLWDDHDHADLTGYPRVCDLRQHLAEDHFAMDFEDALEGLLTRLELSLHRQHRRA